MATREKEPVLLAYVAGIVDGEGCINLYTNSRGGSYYMPRVSVYNSSVPLMELLRREFGGSVMVMRTGEDPGHSRKTYHWYLGYRNTAPFLEQILPYLLVKKQQAEMLLEYVATMPTGNPRLCVVSDEVQAKRDGLYWQMKELNSYRRRSQRLSETTSGPEEATVCSHEKS